MNSVALQRVVPPRVEREVPDSAAVSPLAQSPVLPEVSQQPLAEAPTLPPWMLDDEASRPMWPLILLATATGIISGLFCFYIAYQILTLSITWSLLLTVLGMTLAQGLTVVLLQEVAGIYCTGSHLAYSLGLTLLTLLCFGLCGVVGSIGAVLFVFAGG